MKFLLPLTILPTLTSATTGLLLPIYRYPTGAGQPDWNALISATTTHPTLPFYIIINNQGGAPYNQTPPPELIDWASPLGTLNPRPNVFTLGYIATTGSTRLLSDVRRGIDQYAAWTTQVGWDDVEYDVSLDGIFFDEIDTDPSKLAYNEEISRYARSTLAARPNRTAPVVVLNPGVAVNPGSSSLFDLVDAILQIETCHAPRSAAGGALDPDGKPRCPVDPEYTPFTPASLDVITDEQAAKWSVVVHDFYDSWTPYVPANEETLERDVNEILKKVHSFYITQYGYTANFTEGPASIGNVARLAAEGQEL